MASIYLNFDCANEEDLSVILNFLSQQKDNYATRISDFCFISCLFENELGSRQISNLTKACIQMEKFAKKAKQLDGVFTVNLEKHFFFTKYFVWLVVKFF
jgi:hypothetical protein